MPKWLVGLVIGALALFVANWALANIKPQVDTLTAAIDLTSTVIGFLSVAIGLGAITFTAATTENGLDGMGTAKVAAPGVLAVTGALLLVA